MNDVENNHGLLQVPTILIGISGPSSSGKTTVAKNLMQLLGCKILHQDDFYLPDDQIPIDPVTKEQNWDHPDAIDFEKFKRHIRAIKSGDVLLDEKVDNLEPDISLKLLPTQIEILKTKEEINYILTRVSIVLVDGFMLFHDPDLSALFDLKLFYYSDHDCLKTRRSKRKGYSTVAGFWVDPPNYFDDYVWPAYVKFHRHLFQNNDVNTDLNDYALNILKLHGFKNDDNTLVQTMVQWSIDKIAEYVSK